MVNKEIESELDNRPELPDPLPTDETLEIEEEIDGDDTVSSDTSGEPKRTYILEKAPAEEILFVNGIDTDGVQRTFNEGSDFIFDSVTKNNINSFTFFDSKEEYELTSAPDTGSSLVQDEDGEVYAEGKDFLLVNTDGAATDTLVWLDIGDSPAPTDNFTVRYTRTFENSAVSFLTSDDRDNNVVDPTKKFTVRYRARSIMSRFFDSIEGALDITEKNIREAINSKFINTAEGESLDRIGELFGPLIGSREGRNDSEYRILLRSIVQSFISRGTVSGIRLAVSASTDIPEEDISVREDFENNSYQIVIQPNQPFTGNIVEEVAEIADPSGILNDGTVIDVPKEDINIGDEGEISFPIETDELITAEDVASINNNNPRVSENTLIGDAAQLPPATTVDDATNIADTGSVVPPERISDEQGSGDAANTTTIENGDFFWEEQTRNRETTWGFFSWTELEDLVRDSITDSAAMSDSVSINPTPDIQTSDSTAFVDTVQESSIKSGESVLANDTTQQSKTPVAWGTGDWETLTWTIEHN